MTDPLLVAQAIGDVREALDRWRAAAQGAMDAARDEHRTTSGVVRESSQAAMRACAEAEDLSEELAHLASDLARTRSDLSAVAAEVQLRSHAHQELADQVMQTHATWGANLDQAEKDRQAAADQLVAAQWAEASSLDRLRTAQARAGSARSEDEASVATAELRRAEVEYRVAATRSRQAAAWEEDQRARVERCEGALELAEQAVETMRSAASQVEEATRAVRSGRERLSLIEEAARTAQRHHDRMTQAAEEAVSQANRADEHATTAGQHLRAAERGYGEATLLAADAGLEMTDMIELLRRFDAPMGGGRAGAGAHSVRRFGTGRRPHSADITITRNGRSITTATVTSGGMTDEERALGFPRSTLATHTEARAVRQFKLHPGDTMCISGKYPPCKSCKGVMNTAARKQQAVIIYKWPGGEWVAEKEE